MMHEQIFISYSRRDLAFVKPIKDELEARGFSCWMDLDGIASDERNFKRVIIPAINGSSVFLFLLSSNSQSSEFAIKEVEFAKAKNKRIVLVRINDDPLTDYFLFDFQYANIIDWRRLEQKTILLNNLTTWLGGMSVQSISGMNGYDVQRSGVSDDEILKWALAETRSMRAETRSMRAEVQSMRAEVRSMHEKNQVLLEQSRLTIEKNKLLRHAGQMIVCPTCGKRNMIKDTIYCAACGMALL